MRLQAGVLIEPEEVSLSSINLVMKEMAINFDVFRSFVEDRIGGNLYCSMVVTIESGWRSSNDLEILQQMVDPNDRTHS